MRLDDSAWPYLRISLGAIETPAEFDRMTSWYAERLERARVAGTQVHVLSDAEGTRFNLPLIRHIALWQQRLSRPDLDRCALSVVIVPHAEARRWLTTMFWFARPRAAVCVAQDQASGWQAIVDDVRRRGAPEPPPPAWLADD